MLPVLVDLGKRLARFTSWDAVSVSGVEKLNHELDGRPEAAAADLTEAIRALQAQINRYKGNGREREGTLDSLDDLIECAGRAIGVLERVEHVDRFAGCNTLCLALAFPGVRACLTGPRRSELFQSRSPRRRRSGSSAGSRAGPVRRPPDRR